MSKLFRPFSPQSETNMVSRSRNSFEAAPAFAEKPEMAATNLNSDVHIKGSIDFTDSLRLDGHFEGELHSDSGLLIVGKNGSVQATITVGSAIIEGKVEGNIIAKDKIELRSSAQHYGDIKATRLVVEEGVIFVGKCDVNPQKGTEQPIRSETKIVQEETTPHETQDDEELQEDFLR